MSKPLVECVPNFSEGRDLEKIEQVLAAVRQVEGVEILDVDAGAETNRTVVVLSLDTHRDWISSGSRPRTQTCAVKRLRPRARLVGTTKLRL